MEGPPQEFKEDKVSLLSKKGKDPMEYLPFLKKIKVSENSQAKWLIFESNLMKRKPF